MGISNQELRSLQATYGKLTLRVRDKSFEVHCRIVEFKTGYSKVRVLVEPINGRGLKLVDFYNHLEYLRVNPLPDTPKELIIVNKIAVVPEMHDYSAEIAKINAANPQWKPHDPIFD